MHIRCDVECAANPERASNSGDEVDSVAVGATAEQHAQDLNELLIVTREPHAPVADPESPFVVGGRQLDHVPSRGIADETIERLNDPTLDGAIEASKVATGAWGEDPAAARRGLKRTRAGSLRRR